MARRASGEGCETDMTPMIDVVFQLIIFFIVTVKLEEEKADIILEWSRNGPAIEKQVETTTVIEVDKKGKITMHAKPYSKNSLRNFLTSKRNRLNDTFPILIRGDFRAKHEDIRGVMDVCTEVGIWRINFAALKEDKTP